MTAAVDSMAYAGNVPWHGLGNPVSNDLTPEQMRKAAGLDWTVSKRPVAFQNGKLWVPVEDEFALVRDSDNRKLSMVGTVYKPVQNEAAMDFFTKFVKAGHMKLETAGSLWDGRYVWALARMGKDFKLSKGDEVRGYLLLCSPHVHGKAMVAQFTPIRVVCWNTLSMAIGANLKGDGTAFRMPHTVEFNDVVKNSAEVALGLVTEQMTQFQEASQLLAKKKATKEKVEDYFCEVLQFDAKKAEKKKDGELKEPRSLPKFRAALEYAPGQQLATAAGTWWGALNAVTYVVDHELGRERSTALRNAWLGHTAGIKQRALDLALDRAK